MTAVTSVSVHELPDSMQAVELFSPGPDPHAATRVVQRPIPHPGSGQLLIEVTASAICRTDLQLVSGDLPVHLLPVTPGHQVVGRVAALGVDVAEWCVGDRVGLVWLASACGRCRFCRTERENLCVHAEFTGWDVDGGFANYVLADARFAHRLDVLGEEVSDAAAAPLLCGGVIGYRALRVAQVQSDSSGMRVGMYGFGASATLALQVARHWGAEVYVVTRSAAEVQRALDLGAEWAGTYDQTPPVLFDAAVTFAPAASVVTAALQACDRGAAIAINAIHLDDLGPIRYDDLWWERSIRSVANVTRADAREFLALVAAAGIHTQSEDLPLAAAADGLERLRAGDVRGAFVLRPELT